MKTEEEVNRLLAQAAAPSLRLPRSVAQLNGALMGSRGGGMNRQEMEAFRTASSLGVAARLDFEDVLLAGGSMDEVNIILEDAAAEVTADLIERHGGSVGGEVARLLRERSR